MPSEIFYRSLYAYTTPNPIVELSFQAGTVIEVLNKEPSGWWDAFIISNGQRGWVPSNYFVGLSDEVARGMVRARRQGPHL